MWAWARSQFCGWHVAATQIGLNTPAKKDKLRKLFGVSEVPGLFRDKQEEFHPED